MKGQTNHWVNRPVSAAAVSVAAFAVPLSIALGVAVAAHRIVPRPDGPWILLWWMGQLALSALAFTAAQPLARRLLPLAALLRMSLVFPDRAPSRLSVARRSVGGTKELRQRAARVAAAGDTFTADAAREILALATAMTRHDRLTRGHVERVRVYTDLIADELELPSVDRDRLRWAALLHDVGKLTVDPEILNKPGRPDPDEWAVLQRHPAEGAALIAPIRSWLGNWAGAVDEHHEKWDGSGYPCGLAGEQISLGGRIVAVADVFDTITSKRSYKEAMSPRVARAELTRCAGTHFDPAVVRAFLDVSVGRLRWTIGPATVLSQVPFLGQLSGVPAQIVSAVGGLAPAAAAGAVVLGVGALAAPAAQPSTVAVTSDAVYAAAGAAGNSTAPPSAAGRRAGFGLGRPVVLPGQAPVTAPPGATAPGAVPGSVPGSGGSGQPSPVLLPPPGGTALPGLPLTPGSTLPGTGSATSGPAAPTTPAPTTPAPRTTVPPTTVSVSAGKGKGNGNGNGKKSSPTTPPPTSPVSGAAPLSLPGRSGSAPGHAHRAPLA